MAENAAITKVALITGAGSGIGRAAAIGLAAGGWQVVLTGRRQQALEETCSLLPDNVANLLPISCDVSEPQQVDDLFKQIHAHFDRLDFLFNNAGVNAPAVPLEELTFEQWNRVVSVNLTGAFLCAQAAVRFMKHQSPQGGRILNNGSISAHVPRPHSAPYTATKHAITGLTRSLSLDGRAHNIVCGQIDIGNAVTEMSERMGQGVLQPNGEMLEEPRMDVRYVAETVLQIANLPLDVNVQFMTLMASGMPFIGRG